MDLEARSFPPNIKGTLLAKLREYKTDLNNLKNETKFSELSLIMTSITPTNANQILA